MVILMDIFLELVNNRWIFLSYFFVVFILLTVECKEILCFYFFADKPKSFKKNIKRRITFYTEHFSGSFLTTNICEFQDTTNISSGSI